MAEEAVGPDVEELTGCGRAVERPVEGSAFPEAESQSPRLGFLRAAQLADSVGGCTGPPLACVDEAEMVEADEAVEAIDEVEF